MFKIFVLNFRNLIKNFIKLIIIILLYIGIKNILSVGINGIKDFDYKKIIDNNLIFSNKEVKSLEEKDLLDVAFLTSSKPYVEEKEVVSVEEHQEIEKIEEIDVVENKVEESSVEKIENAIVEVVLENNIKESYNVSYNSVKIKNESKYILSQEMLEPNVVFSNKQDVLIFHTHSCESYTPTQENSYLASGNFRTIDTNYSVTRVGAELENYLNEKNKNVIHLTALHDYPAYNGSYNRSYNTVANALKNASPSLVIDLHRDAVGSNSSYAPAVTINGEKVAQLMFVIGTNGGGLSHNNWNTNLKLAIKIQEKANEMYPGLFRPIIVRNSRYNQNLAEGACIIEVGATGNTLEEAIGSMKYLSNVLEIVLM